MNLLFSLLGAAYLQTASVSDTHQLHLITEENYPFTYTDTKNGKISGSVSDIVITLVEKAEIPYSIMVMPHKRGKREALKKNHCIFAFNETPARLPHYSWVGPLLIGGWAFYSRADSPLSVTSLESLKPYKIAATDGTANTSKLQEIGGFNLILSPTDDVALNMLLKGRVDVMSGGVIDVTSTVKKMNLPEPKMIFYWRKAILSMGCGKETNPDFLATLNKLNRERIDFQPRD